VGDAPDNAHGGVVLASPGENPVRVLSAVCDAVVQMRDSKGLSGHFVVGEDRAAMLIIESFESFYAREYQPVLALALVLTGDRSEAEDLAQEAFLAAFRAWTTIVNPSGWVRVTVSNRAMSWWRRAYAGRRAMVRLAGSEPIATDLPEDTEAFWGEVRRLPRRQAQSIALYYLEGMSTNEVADFMGCDVSTVRIHLSRGRRTLASRVGATE
jgi:RNA polymerase sigma factor (sigma-70 family)